MTHATKAIYRWLMSDFIKVKISKHFIAVVLSCSVSILCMCAYYEKQFFFFWFCVYMCVFLP